ncbi:MAG: hypothetical protein ACLQGT_05080 [Terracidiphilus sp.]
MDWAAWGPTILQITVLIFFSGVLWATQLNQGKRIDNHDSQLNDHTRDLNLHSVQIAKLESWKDGYSAARAVYDRPHGE